MVPRVAVVVFPGTNSEEETLRALLAVGLDAQIAHWRLGATALRRFDAFVLPGGFAYEDRVRAGAVAAHDEAMDAVIAGAQMGKYVLGICNGAQILLESGLVPGDGAKRRATAAFAPNASGKFRSVHVYVRLTVAPSRVPLVGGLRPGEVIPAWASHGEGRLAAEPAELDRLEREGHIPFVYCNARGERVPAPNGSALDAAAVTNREGNVLAIMPHPERDAWTFMHRERKSPRAGVGGNARTMLAPSGGIRLFEAFAASLATVFG
jgi:phosphoribosylformylglycinamidine synthase I